MADEGAGSWNSGGSRQWGSGNFTAQQEGDFVRDRHRRDEWSDISDDEGPVVYADLSRSGEYNYHVVQPQVQPVAGYGNDRAPRRDETPAGFSGFPWQQSVGWRHHQNVFPPYPSVPSGSMEYLSPSYPPGSRVRNMDYLPQSYMNLPPPYPPDSRLRSMDYLPPSYPPSLYHVAQRPDVSYLHHRVPIGEGEKLTNTSVSVTAQSMAMDRRKDLSKSVGYQGSHLEGTPTSYPPALYQVAQKTETPFLHHGVIREGEKMKSNNIPEAEQGIPVEKKEDVSKNAFYQRSYHERTPSSFPPALYPLAQKTDTPFLHGGLIREGEKLKSNNVLKQDFPERKEDLSKNVVYQGSHLERTPTSYTPELYQVVQKTDSHFLHQGVMREGEKRKCNSVPVAVQSIPGEKKFEDLRSKNAIYQRSHLERMPTSYPPALYQEPRTTEMSSLYHGVMGEGEKLKKNNVSVPEQNIPAERNEDPSKKLFYQGSHLEGRPTLYPPAIYQDYAFLHRGVIREGEKRKNNVSVPEQNILAERKEEPSKNVFYQWSHLEGTSASYSHAREGEKLKYNNGSVPEQNVLAERTEDLSKNIVYQGSHIEGIRSSYPPALYQVPQTTEMSISNHGVIAEGEKPTNNKEPVTERNIPEVKEEDPPKNAFWHGSQFEAPQSVTSSLANEQAATAETLEMTRMGLASEEELHPPDSSSSGESLSDSNTAMIPRVRSGTTGVLSPAAFPLVPCHNEDETLIPLKRLSQQCDGNICASGEKEMEQPNTSFKSELAPAKSNENIRKTVQNLLKDCGEENKLDVPGKECPSIDSSNTVAHPPLTEFKPSPPQPNRTIQHLLKELDEEKSSDVPTKDYPSIDRLKGTEHSSMPEMNSPKDNNLHQLSVDAIGETELSESGPSPSGSDRTDQNLLKECGEEKNSDVHGNNFSKPAEQPSLAEIDGPKEKEYGEENSSDVPGKDYSSIVCPKASKYSSWAEMDNSKNEDLPQLSVDVLVETELSESGPSLSRSDGTDHNLLKECGEENNSDVHSDECSKPAEHPSLAEMDGPKENECGDEKSSDEPGKDCSSIVCSKASEYSSWAEIDNSKNEDLPQLSVDVLVETELSESGPSPSGSDRTDHNLLKECGEENNSDVHRNECSKPAEHPSLAEMDGPKQNECGDEKSSDEPGKDCPSIDCSKAAEYSSLAEMDNSKNEDLLQIGVDVLGELRLCKGEPCLPKSDQHQDVPGKDFPSNDNSEVMEHLSLSEMESVKDSDRDHAQSSANVIGVLKKQKRKVGQRKKKKTLVKMAKLLEITKGPGQDTKDACHTKVGQSDTQTQNVQLNYRNKKSRPSFPSPIKEFIYNFSLSPLSDHHTQNPKSHGSTALEILPINSSKPNVKSDLHKKQQNKGCPNVPQVDSLNQPIANQESGMTSLQKEGNLRLTDEMTPTKQTSKPTPNKSIVSSKGSKKKSKVKQRKGFGGEGDGMVRQKVSAAITQPPLRRKKVKRRKSSKCEENGLSLNSCSVEQAPGQSYSTPQELNHSIPQDQSTKVKSEVEVTPAVDRHKRTFKGGRKGVKTLKRGRKVPNDCGPPQSALTEEKEGANDATSAPASTVPQQRKSQGKEKLPEDTQVTSPQKTQPILKGSGFKKRRLRRAPSSAQDIALTVVTAEAAPKTSSPTTSKVTETMVPKEDDVHSSTANASFDFAEEEFDMPVIKVRTKNDVPFETTQSDQKLSKVESQVSLEGSSNTLSKLPGTEAESTCIPPTGAKPVTEISSKKRKQKSTLEQQSTARCNEVEKQTESSRKNNNEQRHRCTEIKLEQALFALSAINMGYPTVQQSPSTNVNPSPVLKRKVGRPVKKKTLLRMAKILNIVQEDTSCSTGNSSNNELIQEILSNKNPLQPPRTKKKLPAKPLVTPTRKSYRAVSSSRADVDYSSTSTVSKDKGYKGHADTCSVALNRLSDTMIIGQSFVNKVAQDSEEITGPESDEQELQESTQVETKTVRAVKSKKKMKGRIKMARRKRIQQLSKVTSLPKDDLLSYHEGGDGKGTAIKPEEAEFALSAVDMGHLADVQQSSSKHTSPSVMLKRKPGRPPSKKTLLRKECQGIQEAKSSSTENGGLTAEESHEEKAQHRTQGQKKGEENKQTVIPPRRSLRAFGPVKEQGDRPSLRATSDHEGDVDMPCASELSPHPMKTTLNETDEQDVEKVTTARVIKRKKKALMPKKKKQGWRKLNEKLGRSKSSQENGQSPSHENGADVTEETCKITEMKPEQTESVPLSTGDTEYCEGLQQRSTNQITLPTVKRKVGRPFKKKTLLRMAGLVKIVQKEKSRASANKTVDDNLERVLQEKRQRHQSSRIKKEKITRPAIPPERKSLRSTELGKTVKDRSFSDLSKGTDDEENTDTGSRRENTSVQDPKKVSETDRHDHQQVPEASDTTVVRNLKKKRKSKSFKFTKKKMGKWKKSGQQLDRGISNQEEVDVDGASDGDSAPVATEDADALKKVRSVPVSSKEEEEEEECAVLHSLQTSLEAQCIALNQENDGAESHTELPSKTINRKSAQKVTQKSSARKRKSMPVVQAASEPSESQPEADPPKCPKVATTIQTRESSQSVSVAQVTTSKMSLRGPKSTAPSTVQKEQSQTLHNSAGTTEGSKSLVDTKTEKPTDVVGRHENKCKVAKDNSFENQFNDFAQSYICPAIYTNHQEADPVPGPANSEQKPKRGRKRKSSSKPELAKVSDPTNYSDASPTVALTTSKHQRASNEQQNTLKKGEIEGKMVNSRKDSVSQAVLADLKIHTQPKSRKNAHSYETPRRSSRASKITSKFCHREEYASSGGGRSLSPTEDSKDDVHSPDKPLHSYTAVSDNQAEGRVVTVVSSDTFEISTSSSLVIDKGYKPDLEISTPVDSEIMPKAEDSSLNTSAEAPNVNVEKKKRRRRVMGWDKRWDRRAQKLKRAAEKAGKYFQHSDAQNVDPSVTGRNGSFSKSRKTDEPVFDFKPADEMSLSDDASNYSGCHTSSSPSTPSPTPSPPPLEDQKFDGGTKDCEEESKSQAPVPDIPNGIVPFSNKARSAIVCKFCKRSFRHISAYTVHKRLHTGEKPYQCPECGKRFSQLSKLKSHRNQHKSQGSIQCPCCNKRFSKKEQLITHFQVHLPSAEHPNKKDSRGTSTSKVSTRSKTSRAVSLSCSVCSKKFPSKQKLQIHKRTHKDEQFPCKECGKTFSEQSHLAAHERVHWPLKPYACSVCGMGFSKLKALKAHSLEHTGETPFFCSHCGYTCSDLPTLRAHQASRICSTKKQDSVDGFLIQMDVDGQVNTPNLFKCHFCKKILNHWCQYTLHLQTHTKAQPYLCDSCGQSYERDSDVKVHCGACCKSSGEEKACGGPLSDIWNSLETDEIPQIPDEPQSPEHMDEECFPQSDYPDLPLASSPAGSDVSILSSHPSLDCYVVSTSCPRTRSSHKRYECQYCGLRFRLSSVLRAHLQTHLPGNKYTCGQCGRVFLRWHKLWLHQRLHQQKGRSFSCSECNVQFHFLALYRQHLQEHAEKRPYACPLCPDTFNNEASLSAHKSENHRLRRALKCDVCGKAFSSLRNWVRHSLLHNGRSSHSCLVCDQSFTNNRALQDHLRIHNNDLRFPTAEVPSEPLLFPHQCWWCTASFSTGELLYAHQICHAVGGKCLPCPPKGPPSAQAPNTIAVTSTAPAPAPAPTQNQPSSAPAQSVSEDAPIPEIDEETLFDYAHPDSLYVVPDPIPPPPVPRHSLSRSTGWSSSQTSSLASSQQIIVLDEEAPLTHSTETSSKASDTSPTVPDASSMQERNLPRTRSQKRLMEAMANLPQLKQTLSSKQKSKEGLKSFSITVTLQDSRGFECADCSKVLSSTKQLHTHYLKHAKGVLAKMSV